MRVLLLDLEEIEVTIIIAPHQDPAGARLPRDELPGPVFGHRHEVAVVLAGVGVLPLQPQLLRLLLLPPQLGLRTNFEKLSFAPSIERLRESRVGSAARPQARDSRHLIIDHNGIYVNT